MKKYVFVLLSLFLISLVSAIPSLNFQNEEIQPGETIFATITTPGEFTKEIKSEDISFYEGRKKVFFESDVTFYDGVHYLYIYTTREGNFSVEVADILFEGDGVMKSYTIKKTFNITEKITTDKKTGENLTEILSIKPGFISTKDPISIRLANVGTKTLDVSYNKIKLSIGPEDTEEINIDSEKAFSYLNISTYKKFGIPIINLNGDTVFQSPLANLDLRSDPKALLVKLFTGNKTQSIIQLLNFGEENMTDIKATSEISFAKLGELEDMQPREMQNLTIIFNPKNPGGIQDFINITYTQDLKQTTLSIPVSLSILPEGSDEEDFEPVEKSCEEIAGTVCTIREICDGEAIFTRNGEYCCLGICESTLKNNSGNSYRWLIGLVIFAALGGGGYYLYKKQKKTKQKNPKEQIKDSVEKFDKRMKGTPETKRISGALSKS